MTPSFYSRSSTKSRMRGGGRGLPSLCRGELRSPGGHSPCALEKRANAVRPYYRVTLKTSQLHGGALVLISAQSLVNCNETTHIVPHVASLPYGYTQKTNMNEWGKLRDDVGIVPYYLVAIPKKRRFNRYTVVGADTISARIHPRSQYREHQSIEPQPCVLELKAAFSRPAE